MTTATPTDLPTQHPVEETKQTFTDLGLSESILNCLTSVGFTHPTPVQAAVIPTALLGKDIIACAQTGTGKTAAFVLPLANRLKAANNQVQAVILCPTREIALQTQQFIKIFGDNHHLTSAVLIGGVKIGPQIAELKETPDIIVATPGRLLDHLERKTISLKRLTTLIFDEADRMLDMGFLPQIEQLMKQLPSDRQTMMFSATMPSSVARLTEKYMREPQRIDVARPGTSASGIEHRLYLVDPMSRLKLLLALLGEIGSEESVLIFTRMKKDVDQLARMIEAQRGLDVLLLHADRTQAERTSALATFREGRVRIMIATDIAARGLDIPEVKHVIHYQVPENPEDYVHRSGRTGRYDATGITYLIGAWMERHSIEAIETLLGNKLPRCESAGVPAYIEPPEKSGSRGIKNRGRRRLR